VKAELLTRGILSLGLTLLAAGCHRGQTNVAAAFPATGEIRGWSRTSDIRSFEAGDLWKYIDGEAEKYLKAGVLKASTADYKFQNSLEAVVDVYTMSKAEGAAQVFNSEPAADARLVNMGDAARLFRQSLIFRKGPHLVRIVVYEESPEAPEALLSFGHGIEQRLPR